MTNTLYKMMKPRQGQTSAHELHSTTETEIRVYQWYLAVGTKLTVSRPAGSCIKTLTKILLPSQKAMGQHTGLSRIYHLFAVPAVDISVQWKGSGHVRAKGPL